MANVYAIAEKKYLQSVHTPDFLAEYGCPNPENFLINPDMSAVEGLDITHTKVENSLVVPMTSIELDTAYLEDEKIRRYAEIDQKTSMLIGEGFTFDNVVFSLSIEAQFNWDIMADKPNKFDWPQEISALNAEVYNLAEADIEDFWDIGKGVVDGYLASGRDLRKQIKQASTLAAVAAIIDNR